MSQKYGEIKIMNQDEYIEYYNKNKIFRDPKLKKSEIYYRQHPRYDEHRYYYWYEWPNGNAIDLKNTEIVVYDSSEPIVYLKSDQILSPENNEKLLENLKNNNTYIIHVIAIEYHSKNQGNISKRRNILIIDNNCNYYQLLTGGDNYDKYCYKLTNKNISNIQLHNSIIDSIKNMKDIITTNIFTELEQNHIHQYLDLLCQVNQSLSKLDEQNKMLLSTLNTQESHIQDLQTKFDEQLKLNETLCKRLFELKN
jgi:hypothetical protein